MMLASIVLPRPTSSARMARPPIWRSTRWATSIWSCPTRSTSPSACCEDGAAAHLAQHALGDVDLVGQLLDRVGVERDQPVEARHERDPLGLATQVVPGSVCGRTLELLREQLERTLVDRPRLVWHRGSNIATAVRPRPSRFGTGPRNAGSGGWSSGP